MSRYVLDASVAAKWFLPRAGETLVAEAVSVFEDYANGRTSFVVPDLFWPELANVLWKAVRTGRMSREAAEEALAELNAQAIATSPSQPLLSEAFAIAASDDRTVYDAIYIALAIARGIPLLTADERLANALGARFPIRWLGAL